MSRVCDNCKTSSNMTSVWGQKVYSHVFQCDGSSYIWLLCVRRLKLLLSFCSVFRKKQQECGEQNDRLQETGHWFQWKFRTKKNQNTQWDDTEKKNNTQPFIYLYISSAHGQTLSMCEKTKNKKTKFRVLISPGSSPEQWGRADGVCYKISSGSRSNAVHTSLYLSSLFVAH